MASRWSDSEIKSLISIWGESRIQEELDGVVRNKSIFQKIADKMREAEHNRDWKQCRQKIKNMKTEYKKAKDNNNQSGRGRKVL